MFKKSLCLILSLILCLSLAACKKNPDTLSVDSTSIPAVSSEPKPVTYINSLTGEDGLTKAVASQRPVAVMINNISVAQPVQTGLNKADIIYETEVEGGITRLLAVFKDIKSVEKIGTVRSARYDYIDLALGHNALYVHHGQDNYHAKPHLNDIARLILDTNNAGIRISNGLSTEHTLYGYGDKIWNKFKSMGKKMTVDSDKTWQTFADAETPVQYERKANGVTVTFSYSYKTTLKYNEQTGLYSRYFNGTLRKDYNTKETIDVKNVFVLNTSITRYPGCSDGKGHMKVNLTSGTGYYLVNGTYKSIKWSKGSSTSPLMLMNNEGTPFEVNPGRSWVCISDFSKFKPEIDIVKETTTSSQTNS